MVSHDTLYSPLRACEFCDSKKILIRKGTANYAHTADVWDGSRWVKYNHCTKLCSDCGTTYKSNYVAQIGAKLNIMTSATPGQILLIHATLGFTTDYLRQLWLRFCRAHTSLEAEAYVISNCVDSMHRGVGDNSGIDRDTLDEHWLSKKLFQALLAYLRLQENRTDFDLNDPVPAGDPEYDPKVTKSTGDLFLIFSARKHDPGFRKDAGPFDVVTDGNYQLNRKMLPDEARFAKPLAGRPKKKKKVSKSMSRCAAVGNEEPVKRISGRTGGLFATVNMKLINKKKKKGN